MSNLSPEQSLAWRGFLDSHARITRQMEETLAPSGLSLSEYGTLALTAEAGKDGIAMNAVAARLGMSCSGFTRLAKRMEKAGYICSNCCPSDGRVSLLTITAAGDKALQGARADHLGDVHNLFLDRLSADDLENLIAIFAKLNRDE